METVLWTLSLRRLAPRVAFLQVISFAKMFNVYKDHMIIMIKQKWKSDRIVRKVISDFTWDNSPRFRHLTRRARKTKQHKRFNLVTYESFLTTQRLRKKILTRHWAKHCSMIFCSDISKPEVAPHSGAQHVGALDACQGSSCRTGKERRTLCPTLLHHLRTPAAKPFSIVGCYLRRKSSHEFCPNVIHVWENMHTHTLRRKRMSIYMNDHWFIIIHLLF